MLEPCQTSKMVLFCKNSLQLKSSNYDITQQTFVFKRRFDEGEYILIDHTSSENVFKTSSRRLGQDQYIRLGYTSSRRLQDIFKTYHQVKLFLLTRLWEAFNTFLKRSFPKTIIYRGVCPGNTTSDKFMVSVQNLQER